MVRSPEHRVGFCPPKSEGCLLVDKEGRWRLGGADRQLTASRQQQAASSRTKNYSKFHTSSHSLLACALAKINAPRFGLCYDPKLPPWPRQWQGDAVHRRHGYLSTNPGGALQVIARDQASKAPSCIAPLASPVVSPSQSTVVV